MTKLTPGKEYCFRVRAENRFGISQPVYSEKIIARYPFGEFVQLNAELVITNIILIIFFFNPKILPVNP